MESIRTAKFPREIARCSAPNGPRSHPGKPPLLAGTSDDARDADPAAIKTPEKVSPASAEMPKRSRAGMRRSATTGALPRSRALVDRATSAPVATRRQDAPRREELPHGTSRGE